MSTDAVLLDAIDVLYNSDGQNIRNRIMHGNLLEIEGKDLEVGLPIANPALFRSMGASGPDPYSPQNIAQHCLNCLEIVDREIANTRPLVAADLAWNAGFILSSDDIDFGLAMSDDFSGLDARRWMNTVSDYLIAMQPGLEQLFKLGLLEWLAGTTDVSIPRFMALGFTFEALYRLTVHLKGYSVLQKEHRNADDFLKFQYRMLDKRPTSICNEQVTESLVEHLKPAVRENAKRILRLAVDARNAIAHGAVVAFDPRTAYAMGHIIVKAAQTLVTAGLHHMTAETAFMSWKAERKEEHGHDVVDWFSSQKAVLQRMKFAAND